MPTVMTRSCRLIGLPRTRHSAGCRPGRSGGDTQVGGEGGLERVEVGVVAAEAVQEEDAPGRARIPRLKHGHRALVDRDENEGRAVRRALRAAGRSGEAGVDGRGVHGAVGDHRDDLAHPGRRALGRHAAREEA